MLKFKCDRCGKEMQRSEAWAIVLAPGAYAAEGAKERTQGEICGDCAEILLKEMIYREGQEQARQGCRALHGPEGSACEGDVHAAARRVVAPYGESGGTCTRADDSRHYGEDGSAKKIARNAEGRCITVARIRMGITQKELADLMYTEDSTISSYERGQVKKIPWDELYRVMPELEEIRRNGCKAYCEDPTACLGGGKCYYARRW